MAERLPPKERTKIPRQQMPMRTAEERSGDFREVNLGFDAALAEKEAQRCLACLHPKCVHACPIGVQVREVIELVLEGEYLKAAAKLREDNILPGVTSRICPHERQCEGGCILGKRFTPVAIGHIERFVADYEQRVGETALPDQAPPTGKRVAIVGGGPAGLSCAADLVRKGHSVTVFEEHDEIGGVLVYGIPEFRLPKDVVRREVENLRRMGIEFRTSVPIGRQTTVDDLLAREGYDAVFIATGLGLPVFMNCPGEHLGGVCSAGEFLARVNLRPADERYDEKQPDVCEGREVAVIGGGNTAMDAARAAVRLGAKNVSIVYRRSEAEMPAFAEEIRQAKEEGVRFLLLHNPVEFVGDDNGYLTGVRLQRMELGAPDPSGRRRPLPVEGSQFLLPIDLVVIAIGAGADPLVASTTPNLQTNKWGYIVVDEQTRRTTRRGVFAGGDVVSGSATVVLAMAGGRRAARSIDEYLETGQW